MQVVIDCDSGTFDLVLNAILCLAAASSVSSAIENTRILCLHESSCCAMARAAGFHVLHRSALSDMSRGFSLQHVNSMAHLDTVMLVREMYILQLLEQGVDVLRLDADRFHATTIHTHYPSASALGVGRDRVSGTSSIYIEFMIICPPRGVRHFIGALIK